MPARLFLMTLVAFFAVVRSANANVILVPLLTTNNPIYVTGSRVAGDTRLFIVEKAGRIRVYDGSLRTTPFLDISSKVSTGSEQGLLSIAFHPDFAATRAFYVNYTDTAGNTVIERYLVRADNPNLADPSSAKTMMEILQPFSNHNGGQLQVRSSDGHLYIGMGDGGGQQDPACRAQNKATLLGKMLRLDIRANFNVAPYYGIPSDNPFTGSNDPSNQVPDEIWALGLRNPWRFSFDRNTNDLWIGDVGQGNWEEVNLTRAAVGGGTNYGWKIMEGAVCNSTSGCPSGTPACGSAALTSPVHAYPHSSGDCSITGGYLYRGSRAAELKGKYLFGDYCTGRMWALQEAAGGGWTNQLLLSGASQLTSFGEDNQGELYVMLGNDIFKVSSDAPVAVPAARTWTIAALAALLMALGATMLMRRSRQ